VRQKEKEMSRTLSDWIKEITEWQDSVFTEATPLSAATHLQREVRELIFDLTNANPKSARLEAADCFFLLIGVAHLSGIDLEEALAEKMVINKARKWGKPDSDGVVEHIRVDDLDGKISWDGETIRWKGKTLLEIFTDEGLIPEQEENILIEISKETDNGTLPTD